MEVPESNPRPFALAPAHVVRPMPPWRYMFLFLVGLNLLTLTASLYIQRDSLTQPGGQTTTVRQQHAVVIGTLTLLMMATLYGYRLAKRETAVEQEKARYLTALERSEARLQYIVRSFPKSVMFQYRQPADGAAAFSYVSPRAATVFGVDAM